MSAASAVCSAVDWISRASAGIVSPSSTRMMSPGTTSAAGMLLPRAVADDVAWAADIWRSAATAVLGARLLDVAHDGVEQHDGEDGQRLVGQAESRSYSHSPAEIAVATSSRMTSTSWNCARNFRQAGTGFSAVSSFRPWRSSRARASASLSPRCGVGAERRHDRLGGLTIRRRSPDDW